MEDSEGCVTTIHVPSFIGKLWYMLYDSNYNSIIAWSPNGKSFIIKDKKKFILELLPLYFKHNNLSSFTRQLNKYGFRKVQDPSVNNHPLEFSHCCFQKDEPSLLVGITRQHQGFKGQNPDETLEDLLNTVQNLRKKQEIFEDKVSTMEKEQEQLCKETAELKKKQLVQQKIVNNIMAFLADMVHKNEKNVNIQSLPFQNSQNHTNKSLMAISQIPHTGSNAEFLPKTNSRSDDEHEIVDFLLENDDLRRDTLPTGAINSLNTIENNLLEEDGCLNDEIELMNEQVWKLEPSDCENMDQLYELQLEMPDECKPVCNELTVKPTVEISPDSSEVNIADLDISKLILLNPIANSDDPDFSPGMETFSPVNIPNSVASDNINIGNINNENELNDHVNSMESDINDLKEILSDSSLNLDINKVLELFTPDGITSITETREDLLAD